MIFSYFSIFKVFSNYFNYVFFQKPVIFEGSNVTRSAMCWDLDYLEKNMPETQCRVLFSPNNNFKYYRTKLDDVPLDALECVSKSLAQFVPPTKTVIMKVAEFHQKLKAWKEGDDR